MSSAETHIVFNDEDEYCPESVDPITIAQYTEISDSDQQLAYEAAFGTTVNSSDYMSQYVKHNRQNNQPTPSTLNSGADALLSPSDLKQFNEVINQEKKPNNLALENNISTMANVGGQRNEFLCKPTTTTPGTIEKNISGESLGTLAAMTQAAKYYNGRRRSTLTLKTPVTAISTGNEASFNNFKVLSFSRMMESFESRKLEYGQPAIFDTANEQYFADFDSKNKRHVLINIHVNRITEIDTVRERFRCQFWISFSWLPTFYEWLDYKDHQINNNLSEWKPSWIPIVTFPELIHQWKLHFADRPNTGRFTISSLHGKEEDIGYDPKFCKFIRCKLECDLTFSTGFLLVNFPLDCQDLPISIHETSGGCVFVAEKRKRAFASIHTISSVMEEWEFLNMMIEIGQLIAGDQSSFAQIKVRLKMERRFEVYLWNIVFFMALISGLTLCSFGVDAIDLGERLAIIITLLLTSVAYQSNVFSTLPNVPYLTLLDKYIVTSFCFMTMVTIETAFLGTDYLDNDLHNKWLFLITFAVFIGYHLMFLIVAIRQKRFEEKKLFMPSRTMHHLYSQSRERMDVDWKSVRQLGSNWKIYTKYPEKLITRTTDFRDLYRMPSRIGMKSIF